MLPPWKLVSSIGASPNGVSSHERSWGAVTMEQALASRDLGSGSSSDVAVSSTLGQAPRGHVAHCRGSVCG